MSTPTLTDRGARHHVVRPEWVLVSAGVLTQVVFPFTDGGTTTLTVLAVVLLAAAAVVHCARTRGPRSAGLLVLVASGGGFLAEAVGVRTGVPFGSYAYTGTLGPELLEVPLVVPLAWTMMAYPALVVGRHHARGRGPAVRVALAAWALATWDVFLDPQMVDAGHWRWAHPEPALPGVEGVPLTNFAGWLLVALVLVAALDRLLPDPVEGASDLLPCATYLWTYASSVMADAVFFGRPPVALVGGLLMGTVAVPLLLSLVRRRRA